MDGSQILTALNVRGRLPIEAIEAARAQRDAIVPLLLDDIDGLVATGQSGIGTDALFFAFHLLGEWREQRAYRPLARLLRMQGDALEPVLGDATTETAHRVMAAVFDGDPEPLYAIIRDPRADEFIRSGMFRTIAMLTLNRELDRGPTAAFLRDCYDQLQPQEDNYVWVGWQEAIAWLGLAELEPLVRQAFTRGLVDPTVLGFKHFQKDLQYAIAHPDAPVLRAEDRLTAFGDTIEELERWVAFQPERAHDDDDVFEEADVDNESALEPWSPSDAPVRNPFRHVGRNDPCPCGSGKKFKKCCIGLDPDELTARINSALRSATAQGATRYDPLAAPTPGQWLALDEQERIRLVEDYHRRAGIRVPGAKAHAIIHVIVENQIALGDETPVERAIQRLMSEGLDRHDAIHAVGSVLAEHLQDLMSRPAASADESPNADFFAAVERLTAQQWLRSA